METGREKEARRNGAKQRPGATVGAREISATSHEADEAISAAEALLETPFEGEAIRRLRQLTRA